MIRAEDRRLSLISHDLLGPESIFVGQIHYGDFYNRAPRCCTLQGTRRWHPDKTFQDVQASMADLLADAGLPEGIRAELSWTFVGESFSVDPKEKIVRALQAAARSLQGGELPLSGVSAVLDTSRLVPFGRVPTVPVDCDGSTRHADAEFVRLPVVAEACRLALETTRNYLGSSPEGPR
jgi:acetylornithine deacetylase/succinyl-diaminopimelate desuccinylase-like protein